MRRITFKDLEARCIALNAATGSPVTYGHRDGNDRLVTHIGHFYVTDEYGGYLLVRVENESGGVEDVFGAGRMTARELMGRMDAFMVGLQFNK